MAERASTCLEPTASAGWEVATNPRPRPDVDVRVLERPHERTGGRARAEAMSNPHRVAIVALDSVIGYEVLALIEVFGAANAAAGRALYHVAVVSERPDVCTDTEHGQSSFAIPAQAFELAYEADTVIIPGHTSYRAQPPAPVLEIVRRCSARRGWIAALGSGTFILAAAGGLDGSAVTTHWRRAEELRTAYPALRVQPNRLYVGEGRRYTAAGGAMTTELALHLIGQQHGAQLASLATGRLVAPIRREGTEPQRVQHLDVRREDPLQEALAWASQHLEEDLTVDQLARRAHMSRRTFDRRFRQALGTTPLAWVLARRLLRAQELLQRGDWPVDRVARASGFRSESTLRHHFKRSTGLTPSEYRQTFEAYPATLNPSAPRRSEHVDQTPQGGASDVLGFGPELDRGVRTSASDVGQDAGRATASAVR